MSQQEHKAVFTADNRDLKKKTDQVANKMQSLESKFKAIGSAIIAAFSIRAIVNFAKECSKLGAESEGVINAYKKMGGDSQKVLEDMKIATRGVIDESDLMALAIKAKNFNIPLQDLSKYLEFATNRAITTGKSVKELTDLIVMGLGRKSSRSMIQLGLSSKDVQEAFKSTTGIMTLISSEIDKMGVVSDTASIRMGRLSTSFKGFKETLGLKINASKFLQDVIVQLDKLTNKLNKGIEGKGEYEGLSKEGLLAAKENLEIAKSTDTIYLQQLQKKESEFKGFKNISREARDTRTAIVDTDKVLQQYETDLEEIDRLIASIGDGGGGGKPIVKTVADYREEIKLLEEDLESLTAGEWAQARVIKNKIKALEKLIDETINYGSAIKSIGTENIKLPDFSKQIYIPPLKILGGDAADQLVAMKYNIGAITDSLTFAEQAGQAFSDQIMAAGIQGSNSMEEFGRVALNVAKKVIAAYVAEAIAAAVKSALEDVPFPFNIIAAGIAGGLAAAVINAAIPDFAAGGAAYGPTLALVGEAPGISRSNPEYIGTAKQLGQMGSGGKLTARISRNDLLFILNEGKTSNANNY